MNKILHFQSWYKEASTLPVFQQLLKAQRINNELWERLHELEDKSEKYRQEVKRLAWRARQKKAKIELLQAANKKLSKELRKETKENTLLIKANSKQKYASLLNYKKFNSLSYPQLAKEIGVPESALRKLIKYGQATNHQKKINAFIKSLQNFAI